MKKSVSIMLMLVLSLATFAQDVILKKNGSEIKAKVENVGATGIEYRNLDNQNGSLYTMSKSEVLMITYENGKKDIFVKPHGASLVTPYQDMWAGNGLRSKVKLKSTNYRDLTIELSSVNNDKRNIISLSFKQPSKTIASTLFNSEDDFFAAIAGSYEDVAFYFANGKRFSTTVKFTGGKDDFLGTLYVRDEIECNVSTAMMACMYCSDLTAIEMCGKKILLAKQNTSAIFSEMIDLKRYAGGSSGGLANGHEWVDLGLPSGTKWATCNVGASSPSDYGNYYAWGETSTKSSYTVENLKYRLETTKHKVSKYVTDSKFGNVDGKSELDPSDDAAYVNWGSGWRMPSETQCVELCEKCKWTWATMGGHKGYNVVGPNGNSFFLPAAGYRKDSELYSVGSYGNYWSRSLCFDTPGLASDLFFGSSIAYWGIDERRVGHSVRPVLAP